MSHYFVDSFIGQKIFCLFRSISYNKICVRWNHTHDGRSSGEMGKGAGLLGEALGKLLGRSIMKKRAEWTLRRVQEFVYGPGGVRLREVSSAYVGDFLDELGRKPEERDCRLSGFGTRVEIRVGVPTTPAAGPNRRAWRRRRCCPSAMPANLVRGKVRYRCRAGLRPSGSTNAKCRRGPGGR